MQYFVVLERPCGVAGEAVRGLRRGWIEGGGAAHSSQAKDRMRSASDESCPARPCVRAKRETYTVGLLASRLVPMDFGHGSIAHMPRCRRTWRAQ